MRAFPGTKTGCWATTRTAAGGSSASGATTTLERRIPTSSPRRKLAPTSTATSKQYQATPIQDAPGQARQRPFSGSSISGPSTGSTRGTEANCSIAARTPAQTRGFDGNHDEQSAPAKAATVAAARELSPIHADTPQKVSANCLKHLRLEIMISSYRFTITLCNCVRPEN